MPGVDKFNKVTNRDVDFSFSFKNYIKVSGGTGPKMDETVDTEIAETVSVRITPTGRVTKNSLYSLNDGVISTPCSPKEIHLRKR